MIKRGRVWLVFHRHEVTRDIVRVDRVGLCVPQRFTADKPGNEKWVELREGEAVGLQEQLQILPVVAGVASSPLFTLSSRPRSLSRSREKPSQSLLNDHEGRMVFPLPSMTTQSCLNLKMSMPAKYMVSSLRFSHCCFHSWLVPVLTQMKRPSVNYLITISDKPLWFESHLNSLL